MKFAELSKWFNAIANAYADGTASWAYPDGVSLAVKTYAAAERAGLDPDQAVVDLAIAHGVSLRRRR